MLEAEVLGPDEVQRAARVFHRDGFVVVRDTMSPELLRQCQEACARVIEQQLKDDPGRSGNRGALRYSFGNQTHHAEWRRLIELPAVLPILEAIWESEDFVACDTGGDYCLPGCDWQPLHADGGFAKFVDPYGPYTHRDLFAPVIVINHMMVDFTPVNGPLRIQPCTQRIRGPIPTLEEEPPWMKKNVLCGPAGTVVIRDIRTWHGGTPNRSDHIRPMTVVQYYAPWYRAQNLVPYVARAHYEEMSPRGRKLCRYIVRDGSEEESRTAEGKLRLGKWYP